jgi:NAD(P)-dependent dehydrogenase (short-subunit alcohol dehydrogenase family)
MTDLTPTHHHPKENPMSTTSHDTGRIVVITGAAGGVGADLVARFLANGDIVLATDLAQDALDTLAASHGDDQRLVTFAGDISSEDDVTALAARAAELGGVDVLVNVAGFFPWDPFDQLTAQRWRQVIDVNLTGYFLVTSAVLPLMRTRGWGRVINFGSASMFPGVAGQVHYVSAKAALVGFTRSLAREVGGDNITVNLITPGLTLTGPVVKNFSPELIESQRKARALPRDQHSTDLVGPVFFLASSDADFVTGQTLNVDGGAFMN